MTTKITADNIEQTTLAVLSGGPAIANIQIANSSYGVLDDTAVNTAGGYVVINGTKFSNGCSVLIGNTVATTVTFVSATQVRAQVPAKVGASYVVYVTNPDGGTAIAVNGLTYSNTPVWATNSTLTPGVVDEAININLSAPSDSNVVYSVAAGSSLPSGVSLASNGLLSGTITGISEDTTYNFTVKATDVELQDESRSFSITITSGDQYYNNTVLHLNGEIVSNTWITDASTNKLNLTINGDTRPVSFNPYKTVWSNFFDGTGDYLSGSLPSSIGTGAFTFECWVNRTLSNGGNQSIFTIGYSANPGLYIQFFGSFIRVWSAGLSASYIEYNGVDTGSWFHIAVTRSGTTLRLFVNGTQRASGTDSSNYNTTPFTIGSSLDGSNVWTGYISNLRLITGTALYTSSFTPSTTPLTAVANTSLLTCHANRIIDSSTNNIAITRAGDTRVTTIGPFTETDTTNGSAYFDGTGDYLTVASSSEFSFGTGDFTVEGWYYLNAGVTRFCLYDSGNGGSLGQLAIFQDSASGFFVRMTSDITYASPPGTNQWVHFAVTRSGTTVRLFFNGTSVTSGTQSTNITNTTPYIGFLNGFGSYIMNGYISNLRVLKGTALYTANFTPPSSPLTAIANTSLLTLQSSIGENNSRFVDSSGINNLITRNGNVTQGTFSPYSLAGWSNYFDGTGDYLSWPGTTMAGDFTVECWVYKNAVGSSGYTVVFGGAGNQQFSIDNTTAGSISMVIGGVGVIGASGTAVTPNVWHHLAWVRQGSTCRVYVNGVQRGTGTSSASATISLIGQYDQGGYGLNGYISNIRVVSGNCLYPDGTTFTPSTTPLTAVANTSLLTCQSNRFRDNSNNASTITKYGDTSVQPFSPFKPTDSWAANTVGGSVYFDGVGDYLSVASNPNIYPLTTTTPYTIEMWINPQSYNTPILSLSIQTSSIPYSLGFGSIYGTIDSTNKLWFGTYSGSWAGLTSTAGAVPLNAWTHVAAVYTGSVMNIYINGVLNATSATSTGGMNASSYALLVGQNWASSAANPFKGYISNLRIIMGTAVYTTAFTPPTQPYNAIKDTRFLLSGTSGSVIDYTSKNNLETVGDVKIRNNIVKYGNTSMYFDGTGDYLYIPSSINYGYGTGDFTIEFWLYLNSTGLQTIVSQLSTNPQVRPHIYYSSGVRLYVNGADVITGGAVTVSTWTHIALSRSATSTRLFINGTQSGSTYTDSNNYGTSSPLIIADYGVPVTGSNMLNGYIDDLRVTRGVARYTANFTPPTSALSIK